LTTSTTVADAVAILNLNMGNVTANVQALTRQIYANANAAAYLTIYSGNLTANNITVSNSFAGNISTDYISPNVATSTRFTGTNGVGLPAGTTSARQAGYAGQIRFNTDLSVVEFFNGTSWIAITNNITDQQITPDGVSQSFALNQSATAAGIIVSINGTVQVPGIAYTVSGSTITFAEIPQATDYVDVRFIATAVTPNLDYETIDTANVTVGTANVIIDTFSSSQFRSAKYSISSTNPYDSQYSEVNLVQKGAVVAVSTVGTVNTGANTISFSANINGSNVNLLALGTTAANQLRIKRIYFNI
jgi:ribosomal protein S8E